MEEKKIRNVAIVGFGYWGQIIKKYIVEKWNLICINGINYADSCSFESILSNEIIDTVFVCTPACTHYEIVKRLLNSGKNVFCEKPLSLNPAESIELIKIAHENGVVLFVDYIYCYCNSFKYFLTNYSTKLQELKKCKFSMFQMGKFYNDADCFQSLGVHFLALLGFLNAKYSLFDISEMCVEKTVLSSYGSLISSRGELNLKFPNFSSLISVSVDSEEKYRELFFAFDDFNIIISPMSEYSFLSYKITSNQLDVIEKQHFDENNNLLNVLTEFENVVMNSDNHLNEATTEFVASVFEKMYSA